MEEEELVDMVVTELTERALAKQREANAEIHEKLDEIAGLYDQIIERDDLTDELYEEIKKYKELIYCAEGMQKEYLYIQGAKDCVVLLKKIGVI